MNVAGLPFERFLFGILFAPPSPMYFVSRHPACRFILILR